MVAASPETGKSSEGGKKESESAGESWFTKWLELIQNLLGVKDLEVAVEGLAKAKGKDVTEKLGEVLKKKNYKSGEPEVGTRSFLNKLAAAFLSDDFGEADKLLDEQFKDTQDKKVTDILKESLGLQRSTTVDPERDSERYQEANKLVEKRELDALNRTVEILEKDDEAKLSAEELESLREALKPEIEANLYPEHDKELFEEDLLKKLADLERRKASVRKRSPVEQARLMAEERQLRAFQELIRKFRSGEELPKKLNATDLQAIYYYFHKTDPSAQQETVFMKNRLFRELTNALGDQARTQVEQRMTNPDLQRRDERPQRSGRFDRNRRVNAVPNDLEDLLDMIGSSRDYGNMSEAEIARRFATLNVNPELYDHLNEELKAILNVDYDILVDYQDIKGLKQIKKDLTSVQKDRVSAYIFDQLAQEIRMAVDEGKSLQERHYEPLLQRYNTLMAIMGLETSKKSAIIDKLNFEVLSFVAFNSAQSEETLKRVYEMATKIGAESNVFKGMLRMYETWRIEAPGGEEIKVGDFNVYEVAEVMGSAITDMDDRAFYGIKGSPSEVGRTYASMMYASATPENKRRGRTPVVKQLLLRKYGNEKYQNLVAKYGNETKLLEDVGYKYWDYFNGVYVYWAMTYQLGDYLGNANPDNTAMKLPAGVPEIFWKFDARLLPYFHEVYNGVKFPELLLLIKTGFNSMLTKEAGEVWSHLLNVDRDPVSQLPSILDAFYGGRGSKEDAIKIQQAFLEAMFEDDKVVLSHKQHKLHKRTALFEMIPQLRDKKTGRLKLDTMARRRDWQTVKDKLHRQISQWEAQDPNVIADMDFEFLAKQLEHNQLLSEYLRSSEHTNSDKLRFYVDHMSDDYAIFDNFSVKRSDDAIKYNLEYFGKANQFLIDWVTKPSWTTAIAFLREAGKIVGKGKVGVLTKRVFELTEEYRRNMAAGEKYTVIRQEEGRPVVVDKDKDGKPIQESVNYLGGLPGAHLLYQLEEREVSYAQKLRMPHGTSKASLAGFKDAVDKEEIDVKYAIDQALSANVLTEEEHKEMIHEFYKHQRGWDSKRPFLTELWAHASGKKIIEYLAANVFDVPAEFLVEWLFGGTVEFVGMWWKYFNGSGAPSHH